MIETGNGIAQRLDDLGLQVNDDPMKIQPVGAAAGLATFEGTRREGGKGNNQYESLGAVSWVARNGKKISAVYDAVNSLVSVSVDGQNVADIAAAYRVKESENLFSGCLDFDGKYVIAIDYTAASIGKSLINISTGQAVAGTNVTGDQILARRVYNAPANQVCYYSPSTGRIDYLDGVFNINTTIAGGLTGVFMVNQNLIAFGQTRGYVYSMSGGTFNLIHTALLGGTVALGYPSYSWQGPDFFVFQQYYFDSGAANFKLQSVIFNTSLPWTSSNGSSTAVSGTGFSVQAAFPGGFYAKTSTNHYFASNTGATPVNTALANADSYGEFVSFLSITPTSSSPTLFFKNLFTNGGESVGVRAPIGYSISSSPSFSGQMITDFGGVLSGYGNTAGGFVSVPSITLESGEICIYFSTDQQIARKTVVDGLANIPIFFRDLSSDCVLIEFNNALSIINTKNKTMEINPGDIVYPGWLLSDANPWQYKSIQPNATGRGFAPAGKKITLIPYISTAVFISSNEYLNGNFVKQIINSNSVYPPQFAGTVYVAEGNTIPPSIGEKDSQPLSVVLVSGSAYNPSQKLDFLIENQYPVDYVFFQLLGTTYAFDGSTIKIANETGGGIIQGLDTVAEADGLRFVAVGSDLAYFYAAYGNALYVFDGGRAVRKLQDLPQVGDLSGRIPQAAFQTSNSALYLPVTGAEILTLKDGVFSKIILPGALTTDVLQMQETVNGMTALTGTSTITGGRLIKYPSASVSVPVDSFRWETAQLGLGENQRVNVRQIVHLIRVKNATASPVNITMGYRYQTQDGYAVSTNNFPVTASMLNNGILKVSYAPPVQAVLSFGVSVETALDVVLLESTVYYSPEGPAFYGPLSTVNGG